MRKTNEKNSSGTNPSKHQIAVEHWRVMNSNRIEKIYKVTVNALTVSEEEARIKRAIIEKMIRKV